jgi:hypothetical protein
MATRTRLEKKKKQHLKCLFCKAILTGSRRTWCLKCEDAIATEEANIPKHESKNKCLRCHEDVSVNRYYHPKCLQRKLLYLDETYLYN